MLILDTNVISELRKARRGRADPKVIAWAAAQSPRRLYLSAITVLELELGVLQAERRDPEAGAMLRIWLESQVLASFEGRVLPVDTEVARRAARLHVPDPRAERDALIAATAMVHRMTVATRNLSDFKPSGVALVNPWEAS